MKVDWDLFLERTVAVFSLLAAIRPGMGAISIFLARQKIRTITQFGPLPEIRVSLFDCLVLLFAAILFTAGILAIVRWQYAAPLAFAATIGLLIHFVPAVWDQMTGSYFSAIWSVTLSERHGKCCFTRWWRWPVPQS